jgi:hypothetical protein
MVPRQIAFSVALALALGAPAFAQVDKVAMRTAGIGCGTCAAVSEVYLRRLQGVDKIFISKSKEAVLVSYKPGAPFQPSGLRAALKKTDVNVSQMQISAHGHLSKESGKDFFVAGKDKFLIVPSTTSPSVPPGATVSAEGIVNDGTSPMELKLLAVKPASP